MKKLFCSILLAGLTVPASAQSLVNENVFKDITTLAYVRNTRTKRPSPAGKYRKTGKPVAFYIGDSTMRNGTNGDGWNGEWGWGLFAQEWFDENELVVENHALGGTSSRTYYNDEWPTVQKGIKAGDYVVISFGHNDGGSLWEKRSTLSGTSATETMVVTNEKGVQETIYTFGQYMRMYIDDVVALGATPILCSRTPRGGFSNGKLSIDTKYRQWGMTVAKEKGVAFIDQEGVANEMYNRFGEWKTTQFYQDYAKKAHGTLHTSLLGAWHMAYCAALAIAADETNPLHPFLKDMTVPTLDIERDGDKPYTFTLGGSDTSARGTFSSGRWGLVYNSLEKGDTVLIAFGENEQKSQTGTYELGCIAGADEKQEVVKMTKATRWELVGSYGWYIHYFVNDIKEKGAIAVLVNEEDVTPESVAGWNSTLATRLGVKLRKTSSSTGIATTLTKKAANGTISYSLSGRPVGRDYKGIVIKDGKKRMQR